MSNFLPDNYSIPSKDSAYTKYVEGENRIRVLGSAITGLELWVEGKPLRRRVTENFTREELERADTNTFTGKKKTPDYFWAFPVWNYKTDRVEILEVRQVTIMRGIEDYLQDEDYGRDPKKYDLVITRDESGERIEYRVKAKPPKNLDEGIVQLYKDMNINLDALYDGEDPFASQKITDKDLDEMEKTFKK